MELVQDWRALQRVFYPVRREGGGSNAPIYLVEDQGVVLSAFAEGEDLSSWVGTSVDELKVQFANREIVRATHKQMDLWIIEALAETHLPAQIDRIRKEWVEETRGSGRDTPQQALPRRGHFLFDALERSWWNRVLPSSFGVLLRLESEGGQLTDFIVVYRKGKLEQFGEPDLSFLGADRRADLSDVTKYLGERLSVPVQGVQLLQQDWKAWSEQSRPWPHPWKEIAWAIQSKRVQLMPFRWSWVGMIATRGFVGL
ncbi:MAG: hypothetical protein ACK5QT_08170 [Oligoflexia bacterium]|jgi:hypothetical protein